MRMRMKRKKRRLCVCSSNGSSNNKSLESCHGAENEEPTCEFSKDHSKIHILSIYDELDSYLAPYTPELHKVRIPPPGAAAPAAEGELFSYKNGNAGFRCSDNGAVEGFSANPEPFDNGGCCCNSDVTCDGFSVNHKPFDNGGCCRKNNVAVVRFSVNPKSRDNAVELVETTGGKSGGSSSGLPVGWAAAGAERGGQAFRNENGGLCCSNNVAVDGFTVNPKPCDNGAELVETTAGISGGGGGGRGLAGGWDQLKLSPEGLKEPSKDFVEGFEKLLEMKFGIMALRIRHGLDAWTLGSHIVNPFEVLSYVAATSTLNRAYFKMWELIQTFQLVPSVSNKQRFLSAHLCEGPGGFIEAVLEYRSKSSVVSEEGTQDPCSEPVDEELHTRDSSHVLDDGIKAHRNSIGCTNPSAAPCKLWASNNANESLTFPTSLSSTSAPISKGSKTYASSPEVDSKTYANSPQVASPGTAAETSGVVEVGEKKLSMPGGCLRANNFLNDCCRASTTFSRAQVNELHELGRYVDTRDQEESGTTSRETLSFSASARAGARTDPLSHGQSGAADRGENLAEPNQRSFVKTSSMYYHDLWFGLTLAASAQQCVTGGPPPPMLDLTRLNEKVGAGNGSSQGHLHFGMDGSGDLTDPANVNAFVEYTLGRTDGQRMDLITADGAFDVSEDFCSQEHSHLHLVFCEVVSALMLQAEGGSFVLKVFDCYTASTLTILFILSSLYKTVEIVRLRTTRICNSERYVVAVGFLGLHPQLKTSLLRLNEEWSVASLRGEKVGLFLAGGFPEQLLQAVMKSNAAISAVQIDGITRALQLADVIGERLPTADSFGKRKNSISMLRRKLQTQKRMQQNAISLCETLEIPCRSQFCSE